MATEEATIRTMVYGDWAIEIEGLGTRIVQAENMPLFECAMEAKMQLTGKKGVFIQSLDNQIQLVAFYLKAKKAVMRIKPWPPEH